MQPIYESLVQLLETVSANPNFLLQNSLHLLPGPVSPPDLVTQSLFSSTSTDTVTQPLLKRFCTKLREKCSTLFKDFLPSGKYFEPTQTLIESSETCPSNNISVERVFGKLDSELHRTPHCSLRTFESKIISTNNSTASWLNDKTAADKEIIIKKSNGRKSKVY
jgi:hypothetical protein